MIIEVPKKYVSANKLSELDFFDFLQLSRKHFLSFDQSAFQIMFSWLLLQKS